MPLLSSAERDDLRARFAALTQPVTLLFFTQTIGGPETALLARQLVDEVASLSERVTVEELNVVLDKDRAAQYGIASIPAIVLLRDGEDTRLRFLGAPTGYEFMSLVEATLLAGTGDSGLSPESRSLIAQHLTTPLDIAVFVTSTCVYCPRVVSLAHRMAVESPLIRATCVEATEFLDLSRLYRVTGVPKTIVTRPGTADVVAEILGAVPEDAFVRAVLGVSLPS